MVSEMSPEVRGAPDAIFGSSEMAPGVMKNPDVISDSSGMTSEKEEEEIRLASETKRGETFSRRCHCPRCLSLLSCLSCQSATTHPYLSLSPWKCIKEANFFMSLLIPGPRSPGRKIDMTDVDPTIVERSIVRHVTGGFIDDVDKHLSHMDAMFHEFVEDLDNLAEGSLSVGTSQPSATPTPRRRAQS
ncbi:uncharacterized protein E5676_scaffold21G001080 [Cucumis melo var. makuwa]|uniref:CACTA en-spm transposon protein n=1 Tax=Cucumis melo var. makuwa TaxID=1194695 RepID=A0A5D3CWQ6_CUCMM|nr:uncharacterized protein E5676_scaffold21G001080 [Cucumis melo var. makuwa]